MDDLEEALIEADLGVETAQELVEALRADFKAARGDSLRLRERLADEISVLLLDAPQPPDRVDQPRITLMIGVNGVGKTTCIARSACDSPRLDSSQASRFEPDKTSWIAGTPGASRGDGHLPSRAENPVAFRITAGCQSVSVSATNAPAS